MFTDPEPVRMMKSIFADTDRGATEIMIRISQKESQLDALARLIDAESKLHSRNVKCVHEVTRIRS